jgi:FkbM family methyltransferase
MQQHFFDVGANNGQTFQDYLAPGSHYDGWKVWCFEPSPRHWEQLIKTVNEYKTRFQIVLCPFGLSDTTDMAPFYEKGDPRGDSFQQQFVVPNQTSADMMAAAAAYQTL